MSQKTFSLLLYINLRQPTNFYSSKIDLTAQKYIDNAIRDNKIAVRLPKKLRLPKYSYKRSVICIVIEQ